MAEAACGRCNYHVAILTTTNVLLTELDEQFSFIDPAAAAAAAALLIRERLATKRSTLLLNTSNLIGAA
jgi:hypothetical protein